MYIYEVCASIVATILLLYSSNQHVAQLGMSVTHVHLCAASSVTKNMNDKNEGLNRSQPYKPPTSPPSE